MIGIRCGMAICVQWWVHRQLFLSSHFLIPGPMSNIPECRFLSLSYIRTLTHSHTMFEHTFQSFKRVHIFFQVKLRSWRDSVCYVCYRFGPFYMCVFAKIGSDRLRLTSPKITHTLIDISIFFFVAPCAKINEPSQHSTAHKQICWANLSVCIRKAVVAIHRIYIYQSDKYVASKRWIFHFN